MFLTTQPSFQGPAHLRLSDRNKHMTGRKVSAYCVTHCVLLLVVSMCFNNIKPQARQSQRKINFFLTALDMESIKAKSFTPSKGFHASPSHSRWQEGKQER